ncbi:MAG: nitrate reductase molybdenum cofactor assembly chaperone [Actinobacteria bacterium]|nr:nitrate reductase molybdenum cofactor assembly chaperone [Actinomycetota bacterium]MBI3688599.1 nitrate reductase molybdenum cofactor assembly chaperone [Actinomycetota bacterium]
MSAALSAPQRAVTFAIASRLLQYPDELSVAQLPLLREAAGSLPDRAAAPLARVLDHLAGAPLLDVQSGYVATFDLQRRNCLYLTYYLNGDTRRRGMALWRFQHALARRGATMADGELPDFLPAILELAADGGEDLALTLLAEHRQGIELLRRSLDDQRSPYGEVIRVVELALPEPTAAALAAARALATQGPPAEMVGLAPFVPVESVGMRQ